MIIETIPCPPDNYCYLLHCENSGAAAIIDPGAAEPVLRLVQKKQLNVVALFCTHHHSDHTTGITAICRAIHDIKVYGHPASQLRGINSHIHDQETVQIEDFKIKAIHTPGHTLDSCCFFTEDALFTGDTLFGAGCGRMFEGTVEQFYNSLKKISSFPEETKLFFGHEYTLDNLEFALSIEPDNQAIIQRKKNTLKALHNKQVPAVTLKLEKETNPFLRCESRQLITLLPKTIQTLPPEKIFAHLRAKKDRF